MRENSLALSLVLDAMVDYGTSNITSKSTLTAMLERGISASVLTKASDMITASTTGSAHSRICNHLSTCVDQLQENPNAFWYLREKPKAPIASPAQQQQLSSSVSKTSKQLVSSIVTKEIQLDYVEKFDCIVA